VAQARRRSTTHDSTIFDLVHNALTTDIVRTRPRVFNRRDVQNFAMKFQQFTGPVMAKSVEDTAFYRYTRLLSLNEVGGDPGRFGTTVAAFHHLNQERVRHWPNTMVATATHDTKRGEDARARIDVLTEFPAEWSLRLRRWSMLNRHAKSDVDGAAAPSADDEFLLYQTLIGAWPMELTGSDEPTVAALAEFRARIGAYMTKAVREGKLFSHWAAPNVAYEAALAAFINRVLDAEKSHAFLADFQNFVTRLALPGMVNALAQLVLKLTIPGVPDCYQGSELWDLNLVDPDNRRPVDFVARAAALAALPQGHEAAPLAALLDRWRNGDIKLYLQSMLLRERRRAPAAFGEGAYTPLATRGEFADHLCAFARETEDAATIVVVPRLVVALGAGTGRMPIGPVWTDTAILSPASLAGKRWVNLFTGEAVRAAETAETAEGDAWRAEDLLRALPVAVLVAAPE
jgi:(1->4)-alpha-D-glucan 1-alpha-D-glucosylmutase